MRRVSDIPEKKMNTPKKNLKNKHNQPKTYGGTEKRKEKSFHTLDNLNAFSSPPHAEIHFLNKEIG